MWELTARYCHMEGYLPLDAPLPPVEEAKAAETSTKEKKKSKKGDSELKVEAEGQSEVKVETEGQGDIKVEAEGQAAPDVTVEGGGQKGVKVEVGTAAGDTKVDADVVAEEKTGSGDVEKEEVKIVEMKGSCLSR